MTGAGWMNWAVQKTLTWTGQGKAWGHWVAGIILLKLTRMMREISTWWCIPEAGIWDWRLRGIIRPRDTGP